MATWPMWGTGCGIRGLMTARVVEAVILGGGIGWRAREGAREGVGLATQGEGSSRVTQGTLQCNCSYTPKSPESEGNLAPCAPELHELANRSQDHVGVHFNVVDEQGGTRGTKSPPGLVPPGLHICA